MRLALNSMCASHAAHSGTSTGWFIARLSAWARRNRSSAFGAGLAVEVDQRLDQADPGRDLGIRPRAELVADGLENGFGLVLLALPG
jgi:hypothetical protein